MATVVENAGSTTRPADQKASDRDLVGIRYPFQKLKGEFPAKVRNKDAVQTDLIQLFKTPIRSRVMKPAHGHNLDLIVFESTGALLQARIDRNVRQIIRNNEPRVTVIGLRIEEENTLVTTTVFYEIQGVRDSFQIETERLDVAG